jgi:hypothetical protein
MYTDTIKVQLNTETEHVHLALKVGPYHVQNFVLSFGQFIKLVGEDKKVETGEWTFRVLKDHVKIYDTDYMRHFRIPADEWTSVRFTFAKLFSEYQDAKKAAEATEE